MSNENWIKFEDEMPKLNQDIEIKYKSGKIFKSRFVIGTSSSLTGIFLLACEDYYADIEKLEGWRPLKSENLIGCIECTNNFKPKEDEKICDSCFYGNKKDDWTLFTDALPLVDKKIEVKFENGSICETKLESVFFTNFHLSEDYEYLPGTGKAIEWRYKKEKKPDFRKLKEGDHIIATNNCGEKASGFIYAMDNFNLHISMWSEGESRGIINICTIKEIIRINPETKEFEEI